MSDDWRHLAKCKDLEEKEAEIFFSLRGPDKKAAKAMCAQCPVRRECLEDSLKEQDRFGIFGGVDHYERRRALQIDREGHATNHAKPMRCPLCKEQKILTVLKRRSWMRVACSNSECGLVWVAKRVVPRKKTEAKETNEAVEPAV